MLAWQERKLSSQPRYACIQLTQLAVLQSRASCANWLLLSAESNRSGGSSLSRAALPESVSSGCRAHAGPAFGKVANLECGGRA
jgi:hypothetical protein